MFCVVFSLFPLFFQYRGKNLNEKVRQRSFFILWKKFGKESIFSFSLSFLRS